MGHKLTDILEVHFLEIPKLFDESIVNNREDPVIQWVEFFEAKTKGVMNMHAEKNKDIGKAVSILEIISHDEKKRMAYEAREAEIKDQATRIKTIAKKNREEGMSIGERNKAKKIAKDMLDDNVPILKIMKYTKLTEEEVLGLKEK
jgi:predicted transposase/invertase (TIGR01784 family)